MRSGVLTGGGDAPGLNAAVRAVVKTAILRFGWEDLRDRADQVAAQIQAVLERRRRAAP